MKTVSRKCKGRREAGALARFPDRLNNRVVVKRWQSLSRTRRRDPAGRLLTQSDRRRGDRGSLNLDAIRESAASDARRITYTPARRRAARQIAEQVGVPEFAAFLLAEFETFLEGRLFVRCVAAAGDALEPTPRALAGALGSRHVTAARKVEIREELRVRKLARRLRGPGQTVGDPEVADYVTFLVLRLQRARGGRHLSDYQPVARFLSAPAAGIKLNPRQVRNLVARTRAQVLAVIRDWPQNTITVEHAGGRYVPSDPALLPSPHLLSDDPREWPFDKMAVFKLYPNTSELLLKLRASEFEARRGVRISPMTQN